MQQTPVYLTIEQIAQFKIMEYLHSLKVFDIKDGVAILDFDREGRIRNVRISKNYKPDKEDNL